MKRESLQTPLLPDPFARLLGSECSLHCCSQTLQSPNPSPPLQRHKPQRGGEEVEAWAAAAARDAAAADADARAGAADGRNHHRADPKGASFVPTSPPSFSSGSWPRFGCAALASWEGFFGGQKIWSLFLFLPGLLEWCLVCQRSIRLGVG